MKKLLCSIFLGALLVGGIVSAEVTTNPDITGIPGGGGVSEGSDVGFGNMTATSLQVGEGKTVLFPNLSTATGDEVAITIEYTTNKASSGSDTGLLINQTDIASPGTSLLIDARRDNVSKFSVDSGGTVSIATLLKTGTITSLANNNTLSIQSKSFANTGFAVQMAYGSATQGEGETFQAVKINPTINQSGNASATDLLINRTETAVGSGAQLLFDAQVDDVSKFSVDNNGNITTSGSINAAIKTYADLSNTADQTFAGTGTGYPILFNTNDHIQGITHSTSSDTENIIIVTSGVYAVFAQPQVTAGAAGDFHMWLQVDTGSGFADVANSNVKLTMSINTEEVIPLILTLPLDAGDKFRLMGSVTNVAIILDAEAPGGEPVIPAIILSMHKL